MLFAKLITEENADFITKKNGGLRPGDECFNGDSVFIYSDDENIPNDITTMDEFKRHFKFNDRDANDNSITEI